MIGSHVHRTPSTHCVKPRTHSLNSTLSNRQKYLGDVDTLRLRRTARILWLLVGSVTRLPESLNQWIYPNYPDRRHSERGEISLLVVFNSSPSKYLAFRYMTLAQIVQFIIVIIHSSQFSSSRTAIIRFSLPGWISSMSSLISSCSYISTIWWVVARG